MPYAHASLLFTPGPLEVVVILLIVLLVFGAKRLPEIGSSMGKGIREFKKSIQDVRESIDEVDQEAPPSRRIDAPAEPRGEGDPKKLSE